MPLPNRKADESHDEFIERCMSDPVMVKEFPDAAQRRAVCESQAKVSAHEHLNLVCEPGSITIEAAADDGEKASLPRFSMVAYTGGPMRVAGWRHSVIVDLAGLQIPSQSRPIRFGHNAASGVGHTDRIGIENGRLVATGVVSRGTEAAREVVVSARNGFPWQASIGATVDEYEFVKESQSVTVNGRQLVGPLYVVRKATLGEISFVDLGADGATQAIVASQTQEKEPMDSSNNPAPDVQAKSNAPMVAEPTAEPQTPEPTQPAVSAHAEADRITAIQRVCAGFPEIEAKAIEEGWDVRRASLEVVRARRPSAPKVIGDSQPEWTAAMAAALAYRGGVEPPEPIRAEASKLRSMPLSVMARRCCELDGVHVSASASPYELIQAAFSTRSLANILKDSARKILLDGYASIDRASLRVARVIEAVDFKPHTLARLTGQYRMEKVAPDGELPHATVTDQGYTVKVDTYGRLVGLTRQDVINDDLGAFLDVPRQIGRGAALALEQTFWSMVESAGTFFSTNNKNLVTGTGSAFGVKGLDGAIAKLRKQTDQDGNPIKARPRFVAVPPDLEATATQIYTSNVLLIAGGTDKIIGANNPHANKYEPIVSEYLTGNGDTSAWYLIADPMDIAAFCVALLRGQTEPTIEETSPDPKYLGTLWRGYFDFGVALVDPRGAVKNAGS